MKIPKPLVHKVTRRIAKVEKETNSINSSYLWILNVDPHFGHYHHHKVPLDAATKRINIYKSFQVCMNYPQNKNHRIEDE